MKCIKLHCDFYYLNKEKREMTIAKSNRCKELLKELEQIQYDYLDTNMRRLTETEKRFYKHRKKIILKYVSDYLDTQNA